MTRTDPDAALDASKYSDIGREFVKHRIEGTTGHTRVTTFGVPARIQQGDRLMSKHVVISPAEAADRVRKTGS